MKRVNITSGTTTTLLAKGVNNPGRVMEVLISNNNSATATGISLSLRDGTNIYYFFRDTKIPSGVALSVISGFLNYDGATQDLHLTHDSGSGNPNLTVMIR
jgi:hypothetical protein